MGLRVTAFIAAVGLSGCHYDYIPVRSARTVCYGSGVVYPGYVMGSSSCQNYAPDRCAPDHPRYEADLASGYCDEISEHNHQEHSKEIRDWIIAGSSIMAAILIGGLVAK